MNNKVKSLIFLGCFIMASVYYHVSIDTNIVRNDKEQKEIAEADVVVNTFTEHLEEYPSK